MNKNRKTSHILNVFQFDANGHVILPATLTIGENPHSSDNTSKIPSTAWIRTYVTGLSYLTGNQSITVSGDATGSGTTAITLTLANTAVTPGTYGSTTLVPVVTVDSKGRITSVTTAAISGSLTFTGDVTGTGTTGTSTGLTLAASGVTAGTYTKVTVDSKGRVTVGANASTTDISEGTNLYYTDTRVGTYLTANSYATQSYVGTQIANLVASAPATLDTLNELSVALGNDPNFATSVATSIGTKQAQLNGTGFVKVIGTTVSYDNNTYLTSFTETDPIYVASTWYSTTNNATNWNTAYGWGNHAIVGYLTSVPTHNQAWSTITSTPTTISGYGITNAYTDAQIQNFFNGANAITGYNKSNWDTAYGWGNHASGGYLTGITSSQVTTALGYTPYNSTNPSGYITGITSSNVTTALGYTPYNSTNPSGYITGITSGNVTTALGYTPYNSTNPSGYISSYTEVDTLASVTGRGASTSTRTTFTEVGASRAGSDTVGDGPWFRWTNVAESRQILTQLNASFGLTTWAYNGSAWVSAMTLTQAGALSLTSTISASNFSGSSSGTNTGDQTNISGNAATATAAAGVSFLTQPNSTWAGRLQLGGNGANSGVANIAVVQATDGNLHMDGGVGKVMYLNYYSNGIIYLNGSTYYISANGSQYNGNSATATTASNASTAGGLAVHTDRNNEVNKIVRTDASGYIQAGWINTLSGDNGTSAITRIYASDDGYIRYYTPANFRQVLDVPTRTGGSASGSWSINAATATSVAWTGVSAGIRENYNLQFRPADNSSSYAGISFGTPGNDSDAGYLLIRGGADSDVYTQNGITIVADKGWLTLAQRTTASKGVRILTGSSTSSTRISVTDSYSTFSNNIKFAGSTNNAYLGSSDWGFRVTNDNGYIQFGPANNSWSHIYSDKSFYFNQELYVNNQQVIHSGNIGSQSVSNASTVGGVSIGNIVRKDTTSQYLKPYYEYGNYLTTETPATLRDQMGGGGLRVDFMNNAGGGSWNHVLTWSGYNIYNMYQLGGYYDGATGTDLYVRSEANHTGTSWTAWRKLLNSSNYSSYALPITGGTMSGPIRRSGHASTFFEGSYNNVGGNSTNSNPIYTIGSAYNPTDSSLSNMYGIGYAHPNFWGSGKVGGWGMYVCSAGVFDVILGGDGSSTSIWAKTDIVAYSDARVKENVEVIENALEKVQAIRGVTFTRNDVKDTTKRSTGVIAQEVLKVLPEVVSGTEEDMYSVAYGNMAGLFIEAIKEQQLQIEELKNKLDGLTR